MKKDKCLYNRKKNNCIMTYKCNFADYTKDGKKCKRKGNLEGICALKQSKPDLKPNDKYYRNVNFPSIGSY